MFLPVILSGGAGERLWPVSRSAFPKPFITMPDGQSLIQKAFLRAQAMNDVIEILTITNRDHYFKTRAEYASIANAEINKSFILEPVQRNTAPAIALAAHYAASQYGEDTLLLILSADQLIENAEAFQKAISEGKKLAEQNYLVAFGIEPNRPETGFGYIELTDTPLSDSPHSYKVKQFVEKPEAATAEAYIKGGKHLWNAGIFCFKAGMFLSELSHYHPELFKALKTITETTDFSQATHGYLELEQAAFEQLQNISVDYAVMEKSKNVAVVTCDIGWNDVGSWNAMGGLMKQDSSGNRIQGEVVVHNSSNCLIQSHNRLVAAVGVKDLIVIDTPDALLVADNKAATQVKEIVSQLKKVGHVASKEHTTVFRPWGYYTVLQESPGFKIKRIEVLPKHSLSLQMHQHRSEHWVVVSGVANVQNNEQKFELHPSESTYIQAGHKHRLSNNSEEVLVIIEVQCGSYLGEDDITRFDDVYGRNTTSETTSNQCKA